MPKCAFLDGYAHTEILPVREWLTFLAVVFGWALVGRVVLEMQVAQPWAVALVWFIGLIWLIGWAAGSSETADYLLKLMGGATAGILLILGAGLLIS